MIKKTSLITAFVVLFGSFMAHSATLGPGPWRFQLKASYGIIPFIIEISETKGKYSGVLKNGKESIPLSNIIVTDQNISIPIQIYEVSLEMDLPKEGRMTGYLVRHNKNPALKTPVIAESKNSERYPGKKADPKIDLNGKWAVTITDEQEKKENGIIVFEQKGNVIHGSILSPTGDYRFMEGFIDGENFEAASFDGVFNYIIRGRVKEGKLDAEILANYKMNVEGQKNEKAELPDAYKLTQLDAMNFEFPDLKGVNFSLNSPKFKNKPVIVTFFGSWCPNCIDEMNFLIPWYKENKKRGIEVIALAFERSLTPEDAKKQLLKTEKRYNIPYTLLIAGSTSQDEPTEKIAGLKNFISFPTTIFLNKKHQVVKVHAGFTGPSTGEFYEKWKKEFGETVEELLK